MQKVQEYIDKLKKEKMFYDNVSSISKQIDGLSQKINEIPNQKKYFELLLFNDTQPSEKKLQQGNGENQQNVQLAYEKVQLSIITTQKTHDELLKSIQNILDTVKDSVSPLPLTAQQARLIQLTSTIESNEAYRKKMPAMVEEAYKKLAARQKEEKEMSDLTNEANTNIQTMNTLLTPILAEINAKRDASPLWNQNSGAIEDSVVRLTSDKAKVDAKLNTTQDPELKQSLSDLGESILSTLNQENVIKNQVIALAARQKEEKEISDLTNEANTNIQTMNTLLTPILAEINAKRDASPLWNQYSKAIEDSVARLTSDKAKVDAKLNATQDPELKKSLSALATSILSTLNQESVIKHRVIVSQMIPNYTAAQNLIANMKGVPKSPDSFPAALEQYNAKYTAISKETQKIKELLQANSATLAPMDQRNPDVITFTDNINPLIRPSSETNLDKIFYTYVAQKMPKPK